MQIFFIIGGVAGWLIVSLIAGKPMPALSLPTILAVVIGGIIGSIYGPMFFKK